MSFHPSVEQWFCSCVGTPTAAQQRGWAEIQAGRHTLIAAPTGSGKTLSAFLVGLDTLFREGLEAPLPAEVRILYVSPLKALSTDIHKNLSLPRAGIAEVARAAGLEPPAITAAVRTGDSTSADRSRVLRTPPHILVTTPESLYLLLTAEKSRQMLRTVRTVIIDEIHAVIGGRRGAHLSLSLERLQAIALQPIQRIGLSATQRPIEEVARYLVGADASCAIVDEGHRRTLDLQLEVPRSPLEAVMSHEVWRDYYDRLAALVGEHRTTLIFVNTRRLAERVTRHLSERLGEDAVTAHHGSLSKERRLDAEDRLKSGRLRALVATASLELGIDIGHIDLVCQIGSPHRIATLLQRVGRSGHSISGLPKGRLFAVSRDDLVEGLALLRAVRRGHLDTIVEHAAPLDVLAQQVVAESASADWSEDELFALVRRAWPYRALSRGSFDAVVTMVSEGFATRRGRRAALVHRDEVHRRVRGRRGARMLALTSGGAIPEVADYRVVAEPDDTFVGTLNEDFAIESASGDIFQLGNTSWRIVQVTSGTVRVADANGAPPTIPFWLGEAPARSNELSKEVSDLRADISSRLSVSQLAAADALQDPVVAWVCDETGATAASVEQAVSYLAESRSILGTIPTQQTLVLERFFDESGGMQLVLHAPFGSRINKAWGLALRKRFCRQFNFELQAAATEDALLLSLGPQHSFPLADVFRYLHPNTAKEVLVQALLDAPVFQTRWRWNATISLAIPRMRGSRKVAPPLQRMQADDLLASVFPDAAACLENIPGDRQIPDHPLVAQALRDCLEEAMDFDGLARVLRDIHDGRLDLVTCDSPEPSPISHEILNAQPYAFLDDAPLEERRSHAVQTRRAGEPSTAADVGRLDPAAIARVREEARPDPRDADELHDALITGGFLTVDEAGRMPAALFDSLLQAKRITRGAGVWFAAERLPEMRAVHPDMVCVPAIEPPASRAAQRWTREDALIELVRNRMSIAGPATVERVADAIGIATVAAEQALLALEGQGVVLRGRFETRSLEFCDRALLARIHRYTLNRLRAEIEPVSIAEFMRFLFSWQHVDSAERLTGDDGLVAVLKQLDGVELPVHIWERTVLPARIDRYLPASLDMLCLSGQVGWGRLSPGRTPDKKPKHLRVALFLRQGHAWCALPVDDDTVAEVNERLDPLARRLLDHLRTKGPAFLRDLRSPADDDQSFAAAMVTLAADGLIVSDGFAGARAVGRIVSGRQSTFDARAQFSGRWMAVAHDGSKSAREDAIERQARTLLERYGVVFRRLLDRERQSIEWRLLLRVFWRLEARGEIRGGRFVTGVSGQQFALPAAVEKLRETRRRGSDGRVLTVSAIDPLNLTGVLTTGERVRAIAANRIAYRDGVPVAVLEGDYLRPLQPFNPDEGLRISAALVGRPVSVASGFVGR